MMHDFSTDWFRINDPEQIDTPALVVYPERVRANIRLALSLIGDPARLRPHVKTHKAQEATLLMLEAGIRNFKCATIAEAEMLGLCGADDVLLAYQPVGPKIERLVQLIKTYPATRFSCLTDNPVSARAISAVAERHGLVIPVFVDLNVGMNRTGIAPGPAAQALYEACAALPGLQPLGLHAYDGHIHETDLAVRTQICREVLEPVRRLREALEAQGLPVPLVVAGGSPSFPVYAQEPDIQCSPGTFVFWDKGYLDTLPEQPFRPAALLLTRVISLPNPTTVCLDLGHKAIAAENALNHRLALLNAPDLPLVSQSEEHLTVAVPAGHPFQVGDVLYALPIHICPTIALHQSAIAIAGGEISGTWKIVARDRRIIC